MGNVCATCGKEHRRWPPDLAFERPDVVWQMKSKERQARSRENDDLCILAPGGEDRKERHFIRGVILLPLNQRKSWGIGIWAEVSRSNFAYYRKHYYDDGRSFPRFPGRLANDVQCIGTLGRRIEVQLTYGKRRPTFWFPPQAKHLLASLQVSGISQELLHELLRREAPFLLEA